MENKKVFYYDKQLDAFYRTDSDEFRRVIGKVQKELTDLLAVQDYFTLEQYFDIMTRNWPEDVREQFYANRYKGWSKDYGLGHNVGFECLPGKNEDGSEFIVINFQPKEKEE